MSRVVRPRSGLPRLPAVVLALAVLITACGSPAGDTATTGDVITLRFESYNYGTAGPAGEGTQQLIDEFEAAHPSIRIDPVGTPAGEIHTRVQAQAAAGDPPDVVQIGWSKFGFLRENLPYVPIEEIAPPDEWAAHTAGMYPAAVTIGEVDGVITGLPYVVGTGTLFYNADLFTSAGLDPNDPPSTWDEVQQAATAITERTDAEGVYVAAADSSKSDWLAQSLINSNGGSVLGPDGRPTFDEPAAVAALARIQQLTQAGVQPPLSEEDARAVFQAGDMGIYVYTTAILGTFAAAAEEGGWQLGTAGLPAYGDQPVRPTHSGSGLWVLSQDEAKQRAAWEFVRFLTSDRGYTIIASVIGYPPLRPGIVQAPQFLKPHIDRDPRLLPAIEQLETLTPYQAMSGRNADQARQVLQDDAVEPILFRGASPQETLSRVAGRVTELLSAS